MREILFRAKRKKNGEWAEGFYIQLPKPSLGATMIANGDLCAEDVGDYIIMNRSKQHSNFSNAYPLEIIECKYYEVIPKTLCQYTGLKDKNGNKIWENDIVKDESICLLGTVIWHCDDYVGWLLNDKYAECPQMMDKDMWEDCEIIGNIFDNPELLEPNTPTEN